MKMNCIITVIAVFCVLSGTRPAMAEDLPKQFEHLTKLNVDHTLGKHGVGIVDVYFDARMTSVIDTLYEHPVNNGGFGPNRRLITAKIDPKADVTYTIDFSPGMSVDPNFIIYRNERDNLKKLTRIGIGGTRLIIPGDGFLYISGHTNNTFNQHRVFSIEQDEIVEIKQPFYSVDLQSVTTTELTLWNDDSIITTLPKGTPVHVILKKNEPNPNYNYLVKTETGLVGWVRFKSQDLYGWNKPNPIEGLYYKGD